MKITIREYREADYAACRSLYGELAQHHAEIYEDPSIAGDDPGRGFDVCLKRTDRRGSWIAECHGRVVGFAGLLDVVGQQSVAEIEPLVVTAGVRDEGIGSDLVGHIRSEAKKLGFKFLSVRPELRNERAFQLYVRLGFTLVGGVELFQDLAPDRGRTWRSGIEILGQKLNY
ncbi:MAG: hypothetical protein A2Z29_07035 [Chloroflexi bacterium RBG_16_56_11]|nr:MAG: hypothetical protein A2Z29_07035 [Chloroflexi bacterium RBG_16_56_11]